MLVSASALLSGCGLLFGSDAAEPTEIPVTVHTVPTFTPTPMRQEASTPTVAPTLAQTQTLVALSTDLSTTTVASAVLTPTVPVSQTTTSTPTAVTATGPLLTVNDEAVNIRSGPATSFALIGTASKDQTFQIVAKNPVGDWWQICCINEQQGWIFGALASVANADQVAVAADIPTAVQPTETPVTVATTEPIAAAPTPAAQPTNAPAPAEPGDSTAGIFNDDATYKIVHFHVLGLNENNGGIRDSRAQHLIFVTVVDANGNGIDGAVVKNLVGDHSEIVTGGKGPGKAEITMYYDPFKLTVASDSSGPTTSQVSNQMGLAFPHIPDIVGQLGGTDYEYAVCPTPEINCTLPIHAVHYSYEITFQKVK
ncbi:MAG: SH3 domain-containing protein [Chloroflexi bacterium]|nr:SH3 domain-containing protein [Chloroflexota bacterium]